MNTPATENKFRHAKRLPTDYFTQESVIDRLDVSTSRRRTRSNLRASLPDGQLCLMGELKRSDGWRACCLHTVHVHVHVH